MKGHAKPSRRRLSLRGSSSRRPKHKGTSYVKRLSFNNQDPIWHDGFHLEDEEENHPHEPHRGILQYHRQFRPHESADLIIEFPDIGHKIYNFAFDRSRCFDPAGAEVLDYRRM